MLIGGRAVEVSFDEWDFYRQHPWFVPAYWLGGMATHGLLIGAAVGAWLFATVYRKPFLELADALVIPGAFLMGLGRIGNFIDGQIVGSVTNVPWAVQFPYAAGFRHPVVLYDGAKNLLLRALSPARTSHQSDAGGGSRALRLLVRVSSDLHRPLPRLSDTPPRAWHRSDAEPDHGGHGRRAPHPIAHAAAGTI